MKLYSYWEKLSFRVICLFVTAMLISFTPALFRDFFADTLIPHLDNWNNGMFIHDGYNWGFRHYLYQFMCIIVFLVQAARIITWIVNNNDKFTT